MFVSCHMSIYVTIHEKGMIVRVPVQDAWVGRAGSLPPPPCSICGAAEVGEGWRAGSCLGILSTEGGSLASKPRVEMAGLSGE